MNNLTKYCARSLVATVVVSLVHAQVVRPQNSAVNQQSQKEEQRQEAKQIEAQAGNGIFVDTLKVYDDSSLQLMLNSARARLATIQALDQSGLLSKIGAVTGAALNQSALGVQITGPPIPQIAVTSNGATGSTGTSTAGGGTTTTCSTLRVQNTVTTTPQMTGAAPNLPQSSGASLPSNYSVSALDALNEQMQLTYEIANLQLLLEGSLTDRFVKGQRLVKPRTTLGFPIAITPQKAYKDAVAVVEVSVQNPLPEANVTLGKERPAVMALLPRERTYNVAAITDHMSSVGGGLVTQVISGGFSYLHGRKSYYIVQDQDTLAMMLPPQADPPVTRFSWQFRPVLGQSFVRSGIKQVFVQLASPIKNKVGCFGQVKVRTYWRKVDRKSGVLKAVIPESIANGEYVSIPSFDLTPVVETLEVTDLGSGQVLTSVGGKFLSNTYVRVGNTYYREGSLGFTSDLAGIRFVASAADIARYQAYLVSRDGSETEILDPDDPEARPAAPLPCEATARSLSHTTSDFDVHLDDEHITIPQGGKKDITISIKARGDSPGKVTFTHVGVPDGITIVADLNPQKELNLRREPNPRKELAQTQTTGFSFLSLRLEIKSGRDLAGKYNMTLRFKMGEHTAETPLEVTVQPAPKATLAVTASDNGNSIVEVDLTNVPNVPEMKDYLIFIGTRVFGLSDAPIERHEGDGTLGLKAIVPTSLIASAAEVEVKPLFWNEEYGTSNDIESFHIESTSDKIVVLKQEGDSTVFLLYGNRLSHASIIAPSSLELKNFRTVDPSTVRQFEVKNTDLAKIKQIVLQKSSGERPVFVSLPAQDSATKNTLTVGGRVSVGTDELTVTGDNFTNLTSVLYNKTSINKILNGKSVRLTGLVAAGVTSVAGEPELQFEFDDGKKNTLKLDVVTGKIETVPRDKPKP